MWCVGAEQVADAGCPASRCTCLAAYPTEDRAVDCRHTGHVGRPRRSSTWPASCAGRRLKRAVDEAERLRLFDLRAVRAGDRTGAVRERGLRGSSRFMLDDYLGPPPSLASELERLFLELCRDAGLPRPQVNVLVAGIVVDMVWHESRLVVELDGHSYHRTRKAFEDDRIRDATLQAAGYRVIRITHRRLEQEPAGVVELLRVLLSPSPERPGGAPRAGVRGPRAAPVS